MEHVEFDGDLLLRLLPSKLAVHIASIKHGDSIIELFIEFRLRLITALDVVLDASCVYTA